MKLFTRAAFRVDLAAAATRGLRVVLIVVLAWAASRVLGRVIRAAVGAAAARIEEGPRRERLATVLLLANSVARWVILFVAAITVLNELGVDVRPVLAAAGVVGLAVGFGAQNLVRDLVSGFFIIMEGQYAVGDLVEINGVFGRVEEVGLRTTRLRDPSGQLRYFLNGSITSTNNYVERKIGYLLNIPAVAPEPRLRALVEQALADFDREFAVLAAPPGPGTLLELSSYATVLQVELMVAPGRQGLVESRLCSRVATALEKAGHPLPPGTEVTLCLRPPAPASWALSEPRQRRG